MLIVIPTPELITLLHQLATRAGGTARLAERCRVPIRTVLLWMLGEVTPDADEVLILQAIAQRESVPFPGVPGSGDDLSRRKSGVVVRPDSQWPPSEAASGVRARSASTRPPAGEEIEVFVPAKRALGESE